MPSIKKLEGKIAIITGASRGIGKAIALLYAQEGARLILSARNQILLDSVAAEICLAGGLKPLLFPLDVTNAQKVTELVDKTLDNYKRVDILVNNAGVTRDGLFVRMSEADWDEVLNTNLKGTFLCMRAVSKVMMKQRAGRIINMASVVGLTGNAGQANYAASKAGILALTKSVAKELGSRNVLVNAIAPGFIDTDMTQTLGEDVKHNIVKTIPVGHFGKPIDVAKAALYLASDESNFITGQVITVDGGMVMG
ncbi:MAG: 3-oxoacyl-[acyl-carrier-protein] reductase [Candidatus Omnitrophica bacterium CG07_land_8_20_14_0_80_50_8]|nr:MAG: 3-oxoacyl-[acyl-carrier-protein] reductase [Candidatus Omnitrophica bacterium CG07_land_8_20_14_0_80_50_8]